jgi:hypothetical protein
MKKLSKPILAEGEATGHAHILTDNIDVYEREDGNREFILQAPTELIHEEHAPITIPVDAKPIKYVSGIVQEYDHFEKKSRWVLD